MSHIYDRHTDTLTCMQMHRHIGNVGAISFPPFFFFSLSKTSGPDSRRTRSDVWLVSKQNDATHYPPLPPADINVMDAAAVNPIQASRRVRWFVEMVNSVFDNPQKILRLPKASRNTPELP